jgi:D-glycero-alpha-D-manno-heptose-7-phosphate kinase
MEFGQSLGKAWTLKRMFSHKISSENLDKIYADAMAHGATGGKLLGAGGGGFFLFYAPPFRKHDLAEHLEGAGLKIRPFRFEPQGLQAWTVRESRNHRESEVL